MPQIGPLEILVVAVLALIVFGPERLPDMARSLAKGVTQLKRMASDVKSEFDMSLEEEKEAPSATKEAVAAEAPSVIAPDKVAPSVVPSNTDSPVEAVNATSAARV